MIESYVILLDDDDDADVKSMYDLITSYTNLLLGVFYTFIYFLCVLVQVQLSCASCLNIE